MSYHNLEYDLGYEMLVQSLLTADTPLGQL
jgi:hypothetical protein